LAPTKEIATYNAFQEDEGVLISGLHDKRQAADLDIVEVNIKRLKNYVHRNDKEEWGDTEASQPEKWWNGVVYVDFPQVNLVSDRLDNVNPAIGGVAVKLINGEVIPSPNFAHTNDDDNENIYGMSLATNQVMYVQGNYNADGDISEGGTGSPTAPDEDNEFGEQNHEAPAALIADSITFLSNNWDDANSIKPDMNDRRATDTEVSAAILTGLVPSGETGSNSYSGGVENFPRFLENWGSRTIRIRGSIVALFESEIGTANWGTSNVYSAPDRAWGFHQKFGEGYLPPGTPNTRRYRGVDFQLIDESEYLSSISRIKTYF
jgi:hypothetical protein